MLFTLTFYTFVLPCFGAAVCAPSSSHSVLQWKAPLCLKPYKGVCFPTQFRLNDFQHTHMFLHVI